MASTGTGIVALEFLDLRLRWSSVGRKFVELSKLGFNLQSRGDIRRRSARASAAAPAGDC